MDKEKHRMTSVPFDLERLTRLETRIHIPQKSAFTGTLTLISMKVEEARLRIKENTGIVSVSFLI